MRNALTGCCVPVIAGLWTLGCSSSEPTESMVLVKGGTFLMGDAYEAGDPDERPAHEVTVDDFHVFRYPVTRGEFREFVETTGYLTTAETEGGIRVYVAAENKLEVRDDASWRDPGYRQEEDHPVVGVSWFDAVRYCNWRSERDGLRPCYRIEADGVRCDFTADGYRLPTEAEFEYALRCCGKNRKYPWGDGDPMVEGTPIANIKDETAHQKKGWKKFWEGYEDGYVFTSPVSALASNELGLHDMGGNVYQWCWDWFDEGYYSAGITMNPRGPESGEKRSARSSGFGCPIYRSRASNRGAAVPSNSFENTGFRLARSAI
jgi:sulfatase modifying factor 1